MPKRIMVQGLDRIQRIDNGDGSITLKDLEQGITQTYRDGRMIAHKVDPELCNHGSAYQTYKGADGEIWHCPACDATLDEHGDVVKVNIEIPY